MKQPLERVGKALDHALKPRFGKHKGKDIGGNWVHKAVGDSEGLSRPDLGMMLAGENPAEPNQANDSVLHLGGGLRNDPIVKAVQVQLEEDHVPVGLSCILSCTGLTVCPVKGHLSFSTRY